jgi:hypothetical protein
MFRAWIEACVEAGVRFADGGEARVVAPQRVAGPPKDRREA